MLVALLGKILTLDSILCLVSFSIPCIDGIDHYVTAFHLVGGKKRKELFCFFNKRTFIKKTSMRSYKQTLQTLVKVQGSRGVQFWAD